MFLGACLHAFLLGVELLGHRVCVYSTLADNANQLLLLITFLTLDIKNSEYDESRILIGTLQKSESHASSITRLNV